MNGSSLQGTKQSFVLASIASAWHNRHCARSKAIPGFGIVTICLALHLPCAQQADRHCERSEAIPCFSIDSICLALTVIASAAKQSIGNDE
ncbi:hypothetical protein EXU57_08295 [Segetibacter sp. 3557_3]|uniref:hypothetical protein n=1 Tax=Segetibacter sp. 3557_3 TaxID=2547429 RepID=UPI0010584E3A|nr:hypothetical protein [Segetibacter sp. 3557_3]TDH26802.1 hypothetical protein EXU57_08295 [Segetibacter sp. 3557_3]